MQCCLLAWLGRGCMIRMGLKLGWRGYECAVLSGCVFIDLHIVYEQVLVASLDRPTFKTCHVCTGCKYCFTWITSAGYYSRMAL